MKKVLLTVLTLITFAQGAVSPALGACGVPGPDTCGGSDPCHCGDTVVASRNLDGSDPVLKTPCPDDGLYVASGVTLQISGTIRQQPGVSHPIDNCSGIVVAPFATKVVVKRGTIVGFNFGVEAGDSVTESQFSRLKLVDNSDIGIRLTSGGSKNVIEKNIITGSTFVAGIDVNDGVGNTVRLNNTEISGDGIRVQGGSDNIVSRNLSQRNKGGLSSGFKIGGDSATVDSNTSTDNDTDGFTIGGTKHTVTHNIAARNANHGFSTVDATGFLVDATDSTFKSNVSKHNGGSAIFDPNFPGSNNKYPNNICTPPAPPLC
jgi:hypothetical protein